MLNPLLFQKLVLVDWKNMLNFKCKRLVNNRWAQHFGNLLNEEVKSEPNLIVTTIKGDLERIRRKYNSAKEQIFTLRLIFKKR